jgi:ubiquinone/menaquinone biosynthesis C-methylase UbiE
MLDPKDKSFILDRYDRRIAQFGSSDSALAIGPKERQEIRYRVILDVGIKKGSSLIDVGCGFGGLYVYCLDQNLDLDYVGLDLNESVVSIARKKIPTTKFVIGEINQFNDKSFDYVVSSSSFNLKLEKSDNYEFIEKFLVDAFRVSKCGVAIDFLSSYAETKSSEIFYYDPAIIFSIAKKLTKKVILRHDYELFEFAVYLYPDFVGWD